jgi:hypothetical protein
VSAFDAGTLAALNSFFALPASFSGGLFISGRFFCQGEQGRVAKAEPASVPGRLRTRNRPPCQRARAGVIC